MHIFSETANQCTATSFFQVAFIFVLFLLNIPKRSGLMAKRQKSLKDHYFAKSKEVECIEILSSDSENSFLETGDSSVPCNPPSEIEIVASQWKEQWEIQFPWIYFCAKVGKVFCKVCREKGGRSAYAKDGAKNLKVSAFQDHARFGEHRRLAWALQSGEKVMEKAILQGQKACDEVVASLFRAAYFWGSNLYPIPNSLLCANCWSL